MPAAFKIQSSTYLLVDRSKNSSRRDGISHKIGDHKHQFRRKDLGGSNLLSRITANFAGTDYPPKVFPSLCESCKKHLFLSFFTVK